MMKNLKNVKEVEELSSIFLTIFNYYKLTEVVSIKFQKRYDV